MAFQSFVLRLAHEHLMTIKGWVADLSGITLAIKARVRIILVGVHAAILDDELKGIVH